MSLASSYDDKGPPRESDRPSSVVVPPLTELGSLGTGRMPVVLSPIDNGRIFVNGMRVMSKDELRFWGEARRSKVGSCRRQENKLRNRTTGP
jgi:hypothetical protein